MGLTSLQVCMDSSDWLQGTIHDDESALGGLSTNNNNSSSPSTDGGGVDNIMGSSGPMRLKPPVDQAQKCPRCDSAHTKFCYYNNYSLSQPRYFCKTCRRYWTKGGTLRNIPVGGGCRKNNNSHKKHNNNKRTNSNSNSNVSNDHIISTNVNNNHTDLQLSTLIGAHHNNNLNNYNNNVPNFLNMEALRNYDLIGNINIDSNNNNVGRDDHSHVGMAIDHLQTTSLVPSFQGLCSPFGIMGLDQHGYVDSSYQRFMLPYDVAFENEHGQNAASIDVKPKLLALDQWQDQQGCGDVGNRESFAGYMGSWSGMMINGYNGSS